MPGNLRQISVGADGATWGLNVFGQIYSYDFTSQSWINVPGALAQISVGANVFVWGINSSGSIYRWNVDAQSWDSIPGALAQISVGADGDVWGLNAAGQIYRFNSDSQGWSEIPGSLSHIAVGFDGAVWGLNAAGQIYRYNPGTGHFDNVPGTLAQISLGADGDVWGINTAGAVYHFNRVKQGWDSTPGTLAQISVGSGDNVWGVSASGAVLTFSGQTQTWTSVSGSLSHVQASSNGSVWGLNASGSIFELAAPVQLASGLQRVPGALAQISLGPDGNVWGLNSSNQIWTFNPETQGWTYIPGLLAQIAVGAEGDVWGINSSNQIWTFNSRSQNWIYVPGSLSKIAIGPNGTVWGINSADQIYRFNSQTGHWTYVPGSLSQISVGADGDVWGLNSLGQIYEFNSQTQRWMYFAGTLAKISVGSTGNVWGLDSSGAVWQFEPQSGSFVQVSGTLSSIAVGFDGSVWGLNSAGQILRFDAGSQSWLSLQGTALSAISAGSDVAVWGLSSASGIYALQSGSAALPLSITSVSNSSPLPLTPLYVGTSGLNSALPVTIQFSDTHGFSATEEPVRFASDGTLTVGTPLYFSTANQTIGAGTVSLTVSQNGRSSAPVSVNIQNLPSVASYGLQPGQATHAVLVFDAMLLSMRINQLQAIAALPGNTMDVSGALSTLNTLLIDTIELRHDVDQVAVNNSLVIGEGTLGDGTTVNFNQSTLDMMDRVNALFLTQTFATLGTPAPAALDQDGTDSRLSPRLSPSITSLIDAMETVNGALDYSEGSEDADHSQDFTDKVQAMAKAVGGEISVLSGAGAIAHEEEDAAANLGLVASLVSDGRTAADALWQDGRFLYGVATNNQELADSAVQAMTNSKANYYKALTDLSLAFLGGPSAGEAWNATATTLQYAINIYSLGAASQQEADATQLNVVIQPPIVADAQGEGFGFVTGTANISNSTGLAAAQTGIDLSSNGIELDGLADINGSYELVVPLQDSSFDYSNVSVEAYDPVTSDVLGTTTVDLSGLTSTKPVQVPALTGSCVDTDDDEDDPDCDPTTGGIRNGTRAHTAISSGVPNKVAKPALPPK